MKNKPVAQDTEGNLYLSSGIYKEEIKKSSHQGAEEFLEQKVQNTKEMINKFIYIMLSTFVH